MHWNDSPHRHTFRLINTFGIPNDQYYGTLADNADRDNRLMWKPEDKADMKWLRINEIQSGFLIFFTGVCIICFLFMLDNIFLKFSPQTYVLS